MESFSVIAYLLSSFLKAASRLSGSETWTPKGKGSGINWEVEIDIYIRYTVYEMDD